MTKRKGFKFEKEKHEKKYPIVKVEEYFDTPLYDNKIKGVSWLVKMTIGRYLEMVGMTANPYQRTLQSLSFYRKLIEDLLDDTTMPPISVVYPERNINFKIGLQSDKKFIILDGLQRTNCILACLQIIESEKSKGKIQTVEDFKSKLVYVEIWEKLDLQNILYKMVVLNTGQKKMDYGHQLDILSDSLKIMLSEAEILFITTN